MVMYNYYEKLVYLESFSSIVCPDLQQLYLPKQQIYLKFFDGHFRTGLQGRMDVFTKFHNSF